MAFRTQKISQMTPKGANLEATDLIEVSTIESGSYVTRSITGQEIIDAAVGNVDWGDIGGTLSAQTDLQTALNAKQNTLSLTTTGSSGASTLVGATLNVPNYTLSGLGGVPTSRTLTINGVTQDLSADRTFTISTGITIGSTAIASGVVGRVLFEGAGNVVQESSSLFWDNTNERLGIGTSVPVSPLHIKGVDNNTITIDNAGTRYTTATLSNNGTGKAQWTFDNNTNLVYFGPYSTNGGLVLRSNGTDRMTIFGSTGNIGINTTTDAGFRLDVNGTARVQNDLTITKNVNGVTAVTASNTTSASGAQSIFSATSNGGTITLGKVSNVYTPYKIIGINDGFIYNSVGGDIAILNDVTTGRIKFTAGSVSTTQMILFTTGNVGINTTTDAGFRLDVNGTARATSFTASPALVSAWANSVVFARFGHTSFNGSTSFGFMQSNAGDCYVNGPNVYLSGGTTVRLEANGSERMRVFSTGNIGINTTTDVVSSLLTLESTTKGFLPPRMTTTQKNAIASPVAGLMVYDTTLNVISYYNGTMWI